MLMMMEWNWVWCYFCLATRKLEVPVGAMPKSFGGKYYCLFGIAVLLIHKLGHLIRKPLKSICICVILAPTVALFQQLHFSQCGYLLDVYLPKDERKMCHRGFGFVTLSDEFSAEYTSQKVHRIFGQMCVSRCYHVYDR